jgi:hypothetical protein
MQKIETYVRLPNSDFYQKIYINPKSIKNQRFIKDEVFFDIDDTTVAMKKKEYELITNPLLIYLEENYPLGKYNK